jgi:hypothetical protein
MFTLKSSLCLSLHISSHLSASDLVPVGFIFWNCHSWQYFVPSLLAITFLRCATHNTDIHNQHKNEKLFAVRHIFIVALLMNIVNNNIVVMSTAFNVIWFFLYFIIYKTPVSATSLTLGVQIPVYAFLLPASYAISYDCWYFSDWTADLGSCSQF